jgi:type II secretory pathway component GspD/PulD (secretin)
MYPNKQEHTMKNVSLACALAIACAASLLPSAGSAEEAKAPAAAPAAPSAAPAAKTTVQVVENASDANKNEALVSISFDETPLTDVIKAFRDATGANIISSGTNIQGIVSVRLDNVPWRKGLSSILDPQGLQLVEQPVNSGIYVVTPKLIQTIPLITQTFTLEHAKADDVAKLLLTTLGKTGMATPFPSANIVIVTATEQQIGECEKIVKSIDKPRTQVYIEARFAELSADASRKLGINYESALGGNGIALAHDFNNTHLTYGQNRSWSFSGTLTPADFELALNAFDKLEGATVFSNPKVIVANEQSANVDMTIKEPNVEVQVTHNTSGTTDNYDLTTKLAVIPGKEEPFVGEAFFSYGITLKVTPRVSPSGLITVEIEPSISEKDTTQGNNGYFEITTSTSSSSPTAKYPIIKMERIKTVFTLQSGSTAVIGGLSKTTESTIDSGVPGLRSIPWIGPHLFGWKSREKAQKEIVIFVTVGIADPANLKEDVGMPKNAILGQGIMKGTIKEPSSRTKEQILSLETPAQTVPIEKKDAATTTQKAD